MLFKDRKTTFNINLARYRYQWEISPEKWQTSKEHRLKPSREKNVKKHEIHTSNDVNVLL